MSKYIKLDETVNTLIELCAKLGGQQQAETGVRLAIVYVNDLPTIEVSEDCISREYMLEKAQEWKNMYPDSDTAREALTMLMNEIDNAPSVIPKKRTDKPDFADCEKCSKTYGTLGCCSTVNNKWVYFCLEGMIDYAYTRGYKDAPSVVPSRETGKWVLDPNGMDWNIPAWRCSECGFVANYIGVEANGLGSNPMNWAGSNYCPNCGARMEMV